MEKFYTKLNNIDTLEKNVISEKNFLLQDLDNEIDNLLSNLKQNKTIKLRNIDLFGSYFSQIKKFEICLSLNKNCKHWSGYRNHPGISIGQKIEIVSQIKKSLNIIE